MQVGVYTVHSVAEIICEMCSVENRWKSFPVRWQKGKETGWMQGPTKTCNGIKLPFVIYFKHFFMFGKTRTKKKGLYLKTFKRSPVNVER